MDLLIVSITLGTILFVLFYFKLVNKFKFWKERGIKGPRPKFLSGNFGAFALKQKSIGVICQEIYSNFKNEKVVGIYKGFEPAVLIRDIEIIKRILIKDFDYFDDRGVNPGSNSVLNSNIFSAEGPTWRVLRQKLSPVFTSGKLKAMYYLIHKCAVKFDSYVTDLIERNASFEIRELAAKYTMESIGLCAFGVDVNGLNDDENIYRTIGNESLNPSPIKLVFESMAPEIAKFLNISVANKEIEEFFKIMVDELLAEREGKPKTRHDFMDLMIDLKEQGQVKGSKTKDQNEISLEINNNILESQAFIFFLAGFETSSSTMSYMLYEFALNPKEQEQARKEVDKFYEKYGSFTYEAINEMEYLEMCMSETLRKYPILDVLIRRCNKTYYIPEVNLTLEKDIQVMIPLLGVDYDPEIFPNPKTFDPERYSKENKANNPFFSFGDGPRNCIGKRFARVQTLLGIATLLRKYVIVRSKKTQDEIRFRPDKFLLESADRIWVDFKKRPIVE